MSKSLDDCIAEGSGTPSGMFPAPSGTLPPPTTAGMEPHRHGEALTLDDCIAGGSGTPGTVPTDADVDDWEIPVAAPPVPGIEAAR